MLQDLPVFNGDECQASEAFDPQEIADIRLHRPSARSRISNVA